MLRSGQSYVGLQQESSVSGILMAFITCCGKLAYPETEP